MPLSWVSKGTFVSQVIHLCQDCPPKFYILYNTSCLVFGSQIDPYQQPLDSPSTLFFSIIIDMLFFVICS
jgi:hypothetical protein